MKTVAIVQARMGSTRLPNKMMLYLNGYPVVEWIYLRAKKASLINTLVFAIPEGLNDDALAFYLCKMGANVFRGSETDVLERFYQCAKNYDATEVIRICGDNPLIDPAEIDHLIDFFHQNQCDYAYNHIPKNNSYVDGLGAEITSFNILESIHKKAIMSSQREHVFNYLWDNHAQFLIKTFEPRMDELKRPDIKLDIDTINDYLKLLKLNLNPNMSAMEIIKEYGK